MKALKICIWFPKFVLHRKTFSMHKLMHLPRYCQLYWRMLSTNQQQMQDQLAQYKTHIAHQTSQKTLKSQLQAIKKSLHSKLQYLQQRASRANMEQVREGDIREGIKYYVNTGFQYLGLYYESLQAFVQGKREVLHNRDFVFQDGMTVGHKEEQAEKILQRVLGTRGNKDKRGVE